MEDKDSSGFDRTNKVLLVLALILFIIMLSVQIIDSRLIPMPDYLQTLGVIEQKALKVNINTADAALLESLPGIGPALAKRVIEYREQNGPFSEIEQLKQVKGIGEISFDEMRNFIEI